MSTPNNYAPPQSVVADIPSTDVPFEKATRLSRLGAVMIDGLIFTIPFIPSYVAAVSVMAHTRMNAYNYLAMWSAMASAGIFFYVGFANHTRAPRDHDRARLP